MVLILDVWFDCMLFKYMNIMHADSGLCDSLHVVLKTETMHDCFELKLHGLLHYKFEPWCLGLPCYFEERSMHDDCWVIYVHDDILVCMLLVVACYYMILSHCCLVGSALFLLLLVLKSSLIQCQVSTWIILLLVVLVWWLYAVLILSQEPCILVLILILHVCMDMIAWSCC